MAKITSYQIAAQHGMMSRSEIDLLKQSAIQLPDNPVVVNIGAGAGTSVLAILETRPDAFIFSVDKKPVPLEHQVLAQAKLLKLNRVWRVIGDSSRVGKHWPYPIDLCFVDGAHHDEAVKADIRAWKPHVKRGTGFMLFHDYKHPNIPSMVAIVDRAMTREQRMGEARYLVCFRLRE